MLYLKEDFPEINEVVYCKVKKVYSNSIMLELVEYNKEGVMVVSEVAPGRIRNIRDYVAENRSIICKVIRVNRNKSHIDLSLRRVTLREKKEKIESIKKEEFAERIYKDIASKLGITKDKLFEKTYEDIFNKYNSVYDTLESIVTEKESIDIFKKLNKEEKEIFLGELKNYIKPKKITIKRDILVYSEESINEVKKFLENSLKKLDERNSQLTYLAGGKYQLKVTHKDKKIASRNIETFLEDLEKEKKKYNVVYNIN